MQRVDWPAGLNELYFLIYTCNPNDKNHRIFNGAMLVNVARGSLIDVQTLVTTLALGQLPAVTLDVLVQ